MQLVTILFIMSIYIVLCSMYILYVWCNLYVPYDLACIKRCEIQIEVEMIGK